jgi:hypothetical protein
MSETGTLHSDNINGSNDQTIFQFSDSTYLSETNSPSSQNSSDYSLKKNVGKPRSIVWGTHIKQGKQISKYLLI